jgi:hypothetical protein
MKMKKLMLLWIPLLMVGFSCQDNDETTPSGTNYFLVGDKTGNVDYNDIVDINIES